jgi:Fe2+ or Zn2+ uptake regulation protein
MRISDDVEAALYHIRKAIEYLKEINKCGSSIGKGTYVPLLKFLADMGMVEEFQFSMDVILEANNGSIPRWNHSHITIFFIRI